MKRKIITLLSLIMLSTAFAASPQISTEQTNMQAGNTGYLKIIISASGTGTLYNTRLVLNGLESPLTSEKLCTLCEIYSNTQKICLDYNGGCYINLGDILGSNVKTYITSISIPSNVTTGYYTASFQVRYQNDTSSASTYVEQIELINITNVTNAYTNFEIYILDAEQSSTELSISAKIANVGLVDAKSVSLSLNGVTNYIGDLASSSSAKTSFSIKTGNTTQMNRTRPEGMNQTRPQMPGNMTGPMPGGMTIPFGNGQNAVFTVTYTNSAGERVKENITTTLNIAQTTTAMAGFTGVQTTSTTSSINATTLVSWGFTAGMFVLVMYFLIKSRRKRK